MTRSLHFLTIGEDQRKDTNTQNNLKFVSYSCLRISLCERNTICDINLNALSTYNQASKQLFLDSMYWTHDVSQKTVSTLDLHSNENIRYMIT